MAWSSLVAQMVKNPPAMQETWIQSLGPEDPLEKGMATHSSVLAWRIPWTEEPHQLQSMDLQRVGHYWAAEHTHSPLNTTRFRENVTDHCKLYSAVESVWLTKLLRLPWIFLAVRIYIFMSRQKTKRKKKGGMWWWTSRERYELVWRIMDFWSIIEFYKLGSVTSFHKRIKRSPKESMTCPESSN